MHKAYEASTSKKNDQWEKVEKKKGSDKRKADEKRGNNTKKPCNRIADHKAPLPKYNNYHALNAPQDHIYVVLDKNIFKKPDEMRGNKSIKDVKKHCAYYKDIRHNTVKCNVLWDEIKRLICVDHFKEF